MEATNQTGVVRVRQSGARCWVGHTGSEDRTVSQVTLDEGELLQVTGDSLVGNENEVQQWYRIAPPAGEFRFVHTRHVNAVPAAPVGTGVPALSAGWSTRGNVNNAPNNTPQPVQVAVVQTPVVPTAAAIPTTAIAPATSTAEAAARQRLETIDGHLATMLAYPPNMWNPTAVIPELQSLAATAPTTELRTQAQQLWAQALKSQQVQQGYAQVAAGIQTTVQPAVAQMPITSQQPTVPMGQPAVQRASYYVETPSPYTQGPLHVSPEFRPLAPRNLIARMREATGQVADAFQPGGQASVYGRGDGPSTAEPEVIDWPVDENGHVGKGWLMPLVARSQLPVESRAGVPPLALTDDEGNVKFLVTPSSGVNLREYLRKEVGIVGPVSKLPDLATPHITAQRVVVLERHE